MALESANKLGAALNSTTEALRTHHSYIKKSQADDIVETCQWIVSMVSREVRAVPL